MKSPFMITPRVIAHLGEDLIKNESIALLELVKNSYDANANSCVVTFSFDEYDELERLSIEDDGDGMSMDIIRNVWLVIGTDYKQKIVQRKENKGRLPLGEKGIGRLGVHKLGRKIRMYTKTKYDKEIGITIDWEDLYTSKHVEDFEIDIEEMEESVHFKGHEHGTKIYIESLKGYWDRRTLRAVYRDLTSLNSPFSCKTDSFNVEIHTNNNVFWGLPNVQDILDVGMYRAHCTISGNQIVDFLYEFLPWDSLTRIHGRRVTSLDSIDKQLIRKVETTQDNGRNKVAEVPFDLSNYQIGTIDIDLVIFERDVSVFSYVNAEKRSLNEYLRENGGVRVYRDDVRVFNYGEKDNDWLGLDSKRVVRAGGVIGNRQVIGSVSLSRLDSSDLKEKTNREGFIENEAYFAFVDAVRYAIDCIVRLRNEDKFNLVSIYKPSSRISEPVVGELNEVIAVIDNTTADEADKAKIKNYLYRIGQQYRDVRDTLIKSANAGLNLGVAVHEMEKNVAQLKGLAEKGDIEKIKEIAAHLEKLVAGYSVFLTKSEISTTPLLNIVRTVLENNLFRFKAHNIKVFTNYKQYDGEALLSKSESLAALNNLIDNAIYWVSRSRTEGGVIYVKLTDEMKGYASIVVYDNGPGFKIPPEMAIQPFVSDKPMNIGMGLGLHITNEVMNAMNGKLLIMDPNDLQIPEKVTETTNNPTAVALCFPKPQD